MLPSLLIYLFSFFLYSENIVEPLSDKNEYKLIWSDEFEKDGLPDISNWKYDVGKACDLPSGCGWGNNELQYYNKNELKNSRVEDNNLIIEAHLENDLFTSARIKTKDLFDFKYGKIESRIKLPEGKGVWAAFWMLPAKNNYGTWPKSGEIDIMEFVGYKPNTIHGTIHCEAYNHMIGTEKGSNTQLNDLADEWHVYSVDWSEQYINFYVDNKKYYTFNNKNKSHTEWPFDQPFYLILNLAIGGNWGGKKGVDRNIFPQKMKIDYVKVYQKK